MESTPHWLVLAQILRPQGRKGEVLADLLTDFPERFEEHPRVWLASRGFADSDGTGPDAPGLTNAGAQAAEVASHWLPVGKNAGRIVLHFAGIDTIERAEQLSGKVVIVPVADRLPLDAGAAYISDLIGCTVYDRGTALGVVEGVQFPMSPDGSRRLDEAAPLLAVRSAEGDEILVPFAKAYSLGLDVAAKSIRMELPEGLADINRKAADPATRSAGAPRAASK
jgi:16S rRNA processing protein RimM